MIRLGSVYLCCLFACVFSCSCVYILLLFFSKLSRCLFTECALVCVCVYVCVDWPLNGSLGLYHPSNTQWPQCSTLIRPHQVALYTNHRQIITVTRTQMSSHMIAVDWYVNNIIATFILLTSVTLPFGQIVTIFVTIEASEWSFISLVISFYVNICVIYCE